MSKQFSEEFLKRIRSIPIEEVAEEYFDLIPLNDLYQAKCIHEGDNTPSLTFFPQTNTFYCFGCHAGKRPVTEGSSVIDFVMWLDKCTFTEAVVKLARLKGYDIPKKELSPEERRRQQLLENLIEQNRTYWNYLQKEPRALEYLYERGILKEDIDKWRLGYIPADVRHPHAGKVVFSIMNAWGQTVGFSYRDMTQEWQGEKRKGPKYVNSSKSSIFDKGQILYGLNFVKRLIREKDYVIIGEGFGDAILGQRLGLPFVSTMGTSLTSHHIALLKDYTKNIILWLDGDPAGVNATSRHARSLREEGFVVKVINHHGKDPDDIFLDILEEMDVEDGMKEAEKLVHNRAVLFSQFEIDNILLKYESDTIELQLKTVEQTRKFFEEMEDGPEKVFLQKRVANRLGILVEDLGWDVKDEEA